jgi:hypothetical protein
LYQWEVGYGPHEAALAPLPVDIADQLAMAARTAVTVGDFGEPVAPPNIEAYANKMSGLLIALLANDRSKLDFWIVRGLVYAGMPDDEIRAVFQHSDPTGKYTDKNGQGDKYLAHTIAKAKAHLESRARPASVYDEV